MPQSKVITPTKVVTESDPQAEAYLNSVELFRQHLKTQSGAEPNLPRTPDPANSVPANECDLPGPMSRDDDEDSSPLAQDLDLAKHVSCSTRDMTTFGHLHTKLLTLLPGASAHGSENYSREAPEPHKRNTKLTHCNFTWKSIKSLGENEYSFGRKRTCLNLFQLQLLI